jgi:hypothetical protein
MRACIAILPLLCACYSANLDQHQSDSGTQNDTGTTSDTAGGNDTAMAPAAEPTWFVLDGTLEIAGGVPVPAGSTLDLTYRLEDGAQASSDTAAAAALPCTRTPTITAITAEDAPDPAVSLGWWSFTLTANEEASCPWALPTGLHLGIGDLDPALHAAMDLAGLQVDGSQLDGLYVQYGDNPLWVFGVAGTSAQYAGTAASPPTAPPLPDGLYTLQGLHLLRYPTN